MILQNSGKVNQISLQQQITLIYSLKEKITAQNNSTDWYDLENDTKRIW